FLSQKKVTKENAGMQTGPATTEPGRCFAAARCRSFLAGKEVRQEKATALLSFTKESNQRKRGDANRTGDNGAGPLFRGGTLPLFSRGKRSKTRKGDSVTFFHRRK
ncbi:MAG: hypothetical protein MR051_03425, partial [Lentisphaeria bacterium]|nr:hypothetical protein [Lentisphaeria bacterium]